MVERKLRSSVCCGLALAAGLRVVVALTGCGDGGDDSLAPKGDAGPLAPGLRDGGAEAAEADAGDARDAEAEAARVYPAFAPVDGGALAILTARDEDCREVGSVTSDEAGVYFGNGNALKRLAAGGEAVTVARGLDCGFTFGQTGAIALRANTAYCSPATDAGGEVRYAPTAANDVNAATLVNAPDTGMIASNGTELVWVSDLTKINVQSGTSAPRVLGEDSVKLVVAIDATHAYWAALRYGESGALRSFVVRRRLDGSTDEEIVTQTSEALVKLAVDGDRVFWLEKDELVTDAPLVVASAPKGGGPATELYAAAGVSFVRGFAVGSGAAYFAAAWYADGQDQGQLVRVPLGGGPAQAIGPRVGRPKVVDVSTGAAHFTWRGGSVFGSPALRACGVAEVRSSSPAPR